MFRLSRPTEEEIRDRVSCLGTAPLSYEPAGMTDGPPPPGYVADRYEVVLGAGQECFERAVDGVRSWQQFRLGWVEPGTCEAPIEAGQVVAVLARSLGLWVLNFCRILTVFDEKDAEKQRFGFVYGTLAEHVERGEERFAIEWRKQDDSVRYQVLAYSQPQHVLARLAYPWTRHCQRRFARDTRAAMKEFCRCCRA